MSDALRPPRYRPKSAEGESDREAPLSEEQLDDRDALIRVVLVAMGVAAYAGVALFTRELPGGGLPYVFPFSKLPSLAIWGIAIVLAFAWSRRKPRLLTLLGVVTLLAAASLLGAAISYNRDSAAWSREYHQKFGE